MSELCFGERVSFKCVPTRSQLFQRNAKYAPREASGKFITIYPPDNPSFVSLLNCLDQRVGGYEGPYILSDVRWGAGPVYFRYGGFSPMWTQDDRGQTVPAIRAPSGELVPDVRGASFTVPDFAEIPRAIAPLVRERLNPTDDGLSLGLRPYSPSSALHFSNGGGVYLAVDEATGQRVVLKEGRKHAGLDSSLRDALTRVMHEYSMLKALASVERVVNPREVIHLGEHVFLAEDYLDGPTLDKWVAMNYPYYPGASLEAYSESALSILHDMEQA
ncbi:MAG: hypothetical protein LBG11_06655, partial [Bifidobacteriaceae bacterium]|nr:hypothetical protein [Bifidobacteriaceae bacterium]